MKTLSLTALMTACGLLCAACAPIGPDYQRPQTASAPAQWKGHNGQIWLAASPADAKPRHDWWTLFGDAYLNQLEQQALAANQTLAAASAKLEAAAALTRQHEAAQLPAVQAGATATRTRISANRPLSSYSSVNQSIIQNDFKPVISVSYEFDYLGKIRRDIESARATHEEAIADQENARLLITAQLASAYFQLRQYDEELRLFGAIIALQAKTAELTAKRHAEGAASAADLAQQRATLESNRAQFALLKGQRRIQEDLIATLSGQPANGFSVPAGKLPATLPRLPEALPAQLLERRPDVAASERAIIAANAQIGVAKAAYYPSLTLTPTYGGYESNSLSNLISTPSLVWSLGLSLAQTIFDGGRIAAGVDYASASYQASTASYRQTVLDAIRETQDTLGTLQQLSEARQQQSRAAHDQDQAAHISEIRYREGVDSALTLALVQQLQIAAHRTEAQIRGSQFISTVTLIKALGGGWEGLPEVAGN